MNKYQSRLISAVSFIILICVMSAGGPSVNAQGSSPDYGVLPNVDDISNQNDLTPDPPVLGAGTVSIGPELFQAYDRSTKLYRAGLMMIRPFEPVESWVWLDAPVTLPQGAEVKQIVAYILDNDNNRDVEVDFIRHPHASSGGLTISSTTSSGLSPSIQYITLTDFSTNGKYEPTLYSYLVRIQIYGNSSTWLNSVRVDYSYFTAIPAVSK